MGKHIQEWWNSLTSKDLSDLIHKYPPSSYSHLKTEDEQITHIYNMEHQSKDQSKRQEAMYWWNHLSSESKTILCRWYTELLHGVRKWESLTGREIEILYNMEHKKEKGLEYYRNNAEEDYKTTPISVLRYISELEKANKHFNP